MSSALEALAKLIKRARGGLMAEGQHIQSAQMVLEPGVLYCSLQYRGANSRGANRGKGETTRFHFRAYDQQYSKSISKARALEILKAEG